MRTHFHEKMRRTRQRLRRTLALHGLFWMTAGLGAGILAAGIVDWAFHVSGGMRLVFLVMLILGAAWLARRYLVRPLSVPVRDLDLALRIERTRPELRNRLSSTVAFLQTPPDDPLAGSPTLRENVITQTIADSEAVAFTEIVDPRRSRRVGGIAAAVMGVAIALVATSPLDAAIALRRLFNPLTGPAWPQRTRLEIVAAPGKIAKGDAFTVEVKVGGVVPDRVQVQYRFEEGEISPLDALSWTSDDHCRGGFEPVTRAFEFSVVGGDARTEWRTVQVVPAPEVVELKLALAYPTYTRLPPEEFPEGRGHVKAVVGSTVTVKARSNKPLAAAHLAWQKAGASPAAISPDGREAVASFVVTQDEEYRLVVEDVEGMTNASRSPKQYRVEAVPDAKPEIAVEQPPGDIDVTADATVPLKLLGKDDFGLASIELRHVKETSVPLGNDAKPAEAAPAEGEKVDVLFESTEGPKRRLVEHGWDLSPLRLRPGSIVHYHATAKDLRDQPGPNVGKSRELRLRVVTKEEFLRIVENEQQRLREELERTLKLQETAKTQVSDLAKDATVIGKLDPSDVERLQSAEMLQRRVREKVAETDQSLLRQVDRMLSNLRSNRLEGLDAEKRLVMMRSELARLDEQHLPPISQSLARARKDATDARSKDAATPSKDPLAADAKDASKDAGGEDSTKQSSAGADSKSDLPMPAGAATKKGAGAASAGKKGSTAIDAPAGAAPEKSAPTVEDAAAKASEKPSGETRAKASGKPGEGKTSKDSPGPGSADPKGERPTAADELARAEKHQEEVVQSLQQMLDQLDQWETVAQVANDARELARRQAEVSREVKKIADETLGKRQEDLTPEQKARVEKAADRQRDGGEQWMRLQRKMDRLAQKTANEDPLAAAALKEALEHAEQANLGGKMADAERDIRQNRVQDASRNQGQIEEALRQVVQSLENRREQELARLVKLLRLSEEEMKQLRAEQQSLLKKTREAEKLADPKAREDELRRLEKRQQELRQKTEEFARRLSRLRAEQASRRSGRAAGRMDEAGRQLDQGKSGQAGEQQDDALEELEAAQDELAQARREAEEELAQEQLAKISDAIRQIHTRQAGVKEELARLEERRKSKGALTRGELQSLSGLARVEAGLAGESRALSEKLSAAKVFANVVEQAAGLMEDASGKMGQRETGPPAARPVDAALRRFEQLLESLKPDQNKDGKKGQQQGGEGQGQGCGGQDGIPNLAQIKLLKLLQIELNEESAELAERLEKVDKPTPDDARRIEELSARQGRLADMLRELVPPAEELDPAKEEAP